MEYNIRVYKPELKQEEGKINNLKGFATITFDEAFCVKSVTEIMKQGSMFLFSGLRIRNFKRKCWIP